MCVCVCACVCARVCVSCTQPRMWATSCVSWRLLIRSPSAGHGEACVSLRGGREQRVAVEEGEGWEGVGQRDRLENPYVRFAVSSIICFGFVRMDEHKDPEAATAAAGGRHTHTHTPHPHTPQHTHTYTHTHNLQHTLRHTRAGRFGHFVLGLPTARPERNSYITRHIGVYIYVCICMCLLYIYSRHTGACVQLHMLYSCSSCIVYSAFHWII